MSRRAEVADAVVRREHARADIRFLTPDLYRPGLPLRSRPDDAVIAASAEPAELLLRVESELAAESVRYRWVLGLGTLMLLMPGTMAIAWWFYFLYVPMEFYIDPFKRGLYVPIISVYEATAFFLWAMLFTAALSYVHESRKAMRRLGVDYRRLRDASPEQLNDYAAEVGSGRWPRAWTLLTRGRGFESYRVLLGIEK